MARCMGITKAGKRCARQALARQTFCRHHMKNSRGKSRRLTTAKCETLRKTKRSPYSKRILLTRGRTYAQIYTACKQRMDHLVKRLEKVQPMTAKDTKLVADIKKEWKRTRNAKAQAEAVEAESSPDSRSGWRARSRDESD